MVGQPGFFDFEERLAELSAKGDDLEQLNSLIDFEMFRALPAHPDLVPIPAHPATCSGDIRPLIPAYPAT